MAAISLHEDYTALRTHAALVDLNFLFVFELYGPDATGFLQGMISNDVKQLVAGEGCLATILTPIGKVIADLIVLKFAEEKFWIICRGEAKEKVMDTLNRFIVSDQVELRDIPDRIPFGIIGPLASERLARVVATLPQKPFDHEEVLLGDERVLLVRDTRFGIDGYQIWIPRGRAANCREWVKMQCEVAVAGSEALDVVRIEAGVPVYGIDFDESNIPLESNLDQALNFQKGCYTGQEVIARVTYLGSVSKKLVGLVVEGDRVPKPGEEVFVQNQMVGRITSAAMSLKLRRPVALAYIQKEYLTPGTQVELKASESRAIVQSLPLVS